MRMQSPSTTIVLPNAEWGNMKRLDSIINVKVSMDGSYVATHVKKRLTYKFEYTLVLTRAKSIEFYEFVKRNVHQLITLTDHLNDVYSGYMLIEVFELEKVKRAVVCGSIDEVSCAFTFEGS